MTTIKPPSEAGAATTAGAVEGVESTAEAAEFQALVDGPAEAAGASEAAAAASEAGAAAELTALVERVQAGELSMDAAVQTLVQRMLDTVGSGLDPAARAELEATLRDALQSDPTLIALRNTAPDP